MAGIDYTWIDPYENKVLVAWSDGHLSRISLDGASERALKFYALCGVASEIEATFKVFGEEVAERFVQELSLGRMEPA